MAKLPRRTYDLSVMPADVACSQCGYLLRGLSEPVCPECGRVFDPAKPESLRPHPQPLGRAWRVIGLASAGAGLIAMLGLHAALAWQCLRPTDLWGSGHLRPLSPTAMNMVPVATACSHIGLYAGALTFMYAFGLCVAASIRRDWLTGTSTIIIGLLAFFSGFLALGMGLVLAGV